MTDQIEDAEPMYTEQELAMWGVGHLVGEFVLDLHPEDLLTPRQQAKDAA